MKAKKLLAVLGVLIMAIPGAAYASHGATSVTSEIVEGHTVFAAVVEETGTDFAAVAGIAAKRTSIGGVLWFNDQELIPASVASEIAAGAYVIAAEAGDDSPLNHLDAAYAESYQFTDPNNRLWIVDRYTYDSCYVDAAGTQQIVPCDLEAAKTGVDLDEDGHDEVNTGSVDLDGDGNPDVVAADSIVKQAKSLFVVEIGATTLDTAAGCGTATGNEYNFVMLIRMDALYSAVDDGKSHGAGATDTPLEGNSHAASLAPVADHTHDTAQIDLWFSESRPPAPATRTPMFPEDTIGGAAPCA